MGWNHASLTGSYQATSSQDTEPSGAKQQQRLAARTLFKGDTSENSILEMMEIGGLERG